MSRAYMREPVDDAPAPPAPAVPQRAAGATLTPETLAWLREHDFHRHIVEAARADRDHGRQLPTGLAGLLRAVVEAEPANPVAAFGPAATPDATMGTSAHRLSEVAERYGLAKRTLRHLCQTGRIDGWQPEPRGHWKVSPESVENYLKTKGATCS